MANSIICDRRGAWRRRRATGMLPALALVLACSADSTFGPTPQRPSTAVASASNYSFSVTPATRTVQVGFSRVRGDGKESVSAFMQRVFASADAAGATRLVVDLSATKGGDSFLLVPLLKGILAREQFTKRGGLIVIVGRDSFSPAQNTATLLKRFANPIFVGRPAT